MNTLVKEAVAEVLMRIDWGEKFQFIFTGKQVLLEVKNRIVTQDFLVGNTFPDLNLLSPHCCYTLDLSSASIEQFFEVLAKLNRARARLEMLPRCCQMAESG